ncbi:MAG: hypothetical protein FWK04_32780 [Nostoc sp. GBBB01]|nr:hypothetical protein [Nostoc sp. GBBB01]
MQLEAITDLVVSVPIISRQSLQVGQPNSEIPVSVNPTGEAIPQRDSIKLRDYQQVAIAQVYAFFRTGIKAVLLYAPTGAGKTVLAAKMIVDAVKKGRRVLFLVSI